MECSGLKYIFNVVNVIVKRQTFSYGVDCGGQLFSLHRFLFHEGELNCPGVLLQVRELAEGVLAVGAVVGLDSQVDAEVLGQVGCVGERFGAVGTLVRLDLCVRLGVHLHV